LSSMVIEKNNKWLLGGLILTLILTWRMSTQDVSEQTVLPSRVLAKTNNHPSAQFPAHDFQSFHKNVVLSEKLNIRKSYESKTDLFALSENIEAPQEKNQNNVKPQVVVLTPLPFKYIGRWKDQTQTLVILTMNDEVVSAKVGDTIFNQYQLQEITENAQGLTMAFLNQNVHQTQILQVGKAENE